MSSIAISATSDADRPRATALAARLRIPLTDAVVDHDFSWLLVVTPQRLELRRCGPQSPGPVYVDFCAGRQAYRRRFGGGLKQTLARAVGINHNRTLSVLDATAGFGRDAFALAALGCRVTMLERSPVIAVLLEDGLRRAYDDPDIGGWIKTRLELVGAESTDYMRQIPDAKSCRPDVVYLDPMYPQRRKSALVKKELQILQALVGADDNGEELLAAALACARHRVVVKRPGKPAPPLSRSILPDTRMEGKTTRYDIYFSVCHFSRREL